MSIWGDGLGRGPRARAASGSATTSPTFIRGSSEPIGSWKTMETSRRNCRSSRSRAPTTSCPSTPIEPAVGVSRAHSSRISVDLPEPDSPTTPNRWPRPMSNDASASACTGSARRHSVDRDPR